MQDEFYIRQAIKIDDKEVRNENRKYRPSSTLEKRD